MKMFTFVLGGLRHLLVFVVTGIILLLCCLYFQCEVYHFTPSAPFAGNHYYNPYQVDSNSRWAQSNFHAHAIAWNRLTNGQQESKEIFNVYRQMGYDIACISNYHDIPDPEPAAGLLNIPVYEHGYNAGKTHQMVFEPTHINFFDLPLLQNIHTKQSVLQSLGKQSACIALNHPAKRNGYTQEDLQYLSGYHLVEVFNHSIQSAAHWDAALSSGKAVWCLGNDDVHDIEKHSELGVCWTMVASVNTEQDVVPRLKSGRHYIVKGTGAVNLNYLRSLQMHGDTLRLRLAKPASEIRFIGQSGSVLAVSAQREVDGYVFNAVDSYVRVEVETNGQLMYLNPVVRYDGVQPPSNVGTAQVNLTGTIIFRFLLLMLTVSLLFRLHRNGISGLVKVWKPRRLKPETGLTIGAE